MNARIVKAVVILAVLGAGGAGMRAGALRARRGAAPSAAGPGVDVRKTLDYVQSWARRDRWDAFPESPSFAYYNLYVTRALGGVVSPPLRDRVVDYARRCQAADGGFTPAPGAGASHVVPTLYALRALALLGASDAIDRKGAAAYVASLQASGGGYRGAVSDAQASLGTTFHAIAALDLLGALERIDRASAVAYVASHRADDGGFSLLPGRPASPAGTFMAVRSLKLLGALDGATSAAIARHLATSRYSGRLRAGDFTSLPDVEDEDHVLSTLADVGRLDLVDRAQVERFVTGLYVSENGGFGPQPGLGTTPPSTYHAVACLVTLGRFDAPAVAGWVPPRRGCDVLCPLRHGDSVATRSVAASAWRASFEPPAS